MAIQLSKPFFDRHNLTLYHADCLETLAAMPADSCDAVLTDPPYCSGGRQQSQARHTISKNNSRRDEEWFLGDNMGGDSYLWFMRAVGRACGRIASVGSQSFVFTDWRQYGNVVTAWETVGWTLRNVVVWDKARGGAMGSFWRNNHEWICVFTKGKPRRLAHRSCFNTWTGTKPQGGLHPTEKPVGLVEYLLSTVKPGLPILDPFCGSGTTGVACIGTGHGFVGIDNCRAYCETAVGRFEQALASRNKEVKSV